MRLLGVQRVGELGMEHVSFRRRGKGWSSLTGITDQRSCRRARYLRWAGSVDGAIVCEAIDYTWNELLLLSCMTIGDITDDCRLSNRHSAPNDMPTARPCFSLLYSSHVFQLTNQNLTPNACSALSNQVSALPRKQWRTCKRASTSRTATTGISAGKRV